MVSKLSHYINSLKFISCVMVVLIHSANPYKNLDAISFFLTRQLPVGAVSIFFFVSGFLMAWKCHSNSSLKFVFSYTIKKIFEVAAAYIVWILLFYCLFYVRCSFDAPAGFYCEKITSGFLSIIGVSERYPLVYQFWFLRDLILYHLFFIVFFAFSGANFKAGIVYFVYFTFISIAIYVSVMSQFFENKEFVGIFILDFVAYFLGVGVSRIINSTSRVGIWVPRALFVVFIYLFAAFSISKFVMNQGYGGGFAVILSTIFISMVSYLFVCLFGDHLLRSMVKPCVWVFAVHGVFLVLVALLISRLTLPQPLEILSVFILGCVISFGSYFLLPARFKSMFSLLTDMRLKVKDKGGMTI